MQLFATLMWLSIWSAFCRNSAARRFDAVQSFGARAVAEAARAAGAKLVHMSAIGADPESTSGYGASKGEGENAVREVLKDAIIFRPSIIFGPEDDFFNRFGAMARISPALPLIGGGKTRFQPVYVGDVAEAISKAVDGNLKAGYTYELGGPETLTFRECLELLLKEIGRKRFLVHLPWFAANMIGTMIGWFPGAPITRDQVEMLRNDNVVSDSANRESRTFAGIGIEPTPMSAVLPSYLVQYRPHGQFTKMDQSET